MVMQVVSPFDQVIVFVSTWQPSQAGGGVGLTGAAVTVMVFVTVTAAGQLSTGGGIGGGTGVPDGGGTGVPDGGGVEVQVSVQVDTQVVGI
jgi:hypothetical protein